MWNGPLEQTPLSSSPSVITLHKSNSAVTMVTFHSVQVSSECNQIPPPPKTASYLNITSSITCPASHRGSTSSIGQNALAITSSPPPSLLWHFCADWNEKRNLLAVIWCDATNPDTTNHRSRSPSLHTDLWPPASSVTSASGETLDSFLLQMFCGWTVDNWAVILINWHSLKFEKCVFLAPKPNFLHVFWGIRVLNLLLLVISQVQSWIPTVTNNPKEMQVLMVLQNDSVWDNPFF